MLLANLTFASESFPYQYTKWDSIAATLGIEIQYPSLGNETPEEVSCAFEKVADLVKIADGFILDTQLYFGNHPELEACFHDRIKRGARAFITPKGGHEASQKWWNRFLSRYDITSSGVQIVGPNCERQKLRFSRSDDCFRDPSLFTGIDVLVIDNPFALWYGGESWPVVVGTRCHWSVDAITDLPADWNGRELAPMAVWYGTPGAVLVATGHGLVADSCTNMFGITLAGIDDNEMLARNILRFLCEGEIRPSPEDFCKRIEVNLVDFVLQVLKGLSQNWWTDFVPLTIRQECAKRQEEEGNRFPKEAYLDLIALKNLMQKNWKAFDGHFRAIKLDCGKDKSLKWMDQLNELRRLVGHPLKVHVSGYSFSSADQDFLLECDSLVLALVRRVRNTSG